MFKTSNWEELLTLAGSRQVRYIGHIDNKPVYQSPNGIKVQYLG